ncbi:MAG: beta-propeller fold lactonase family protein [Coriobacteriia bacterium]|nr:beta-propeller fold lactonase family protein [Coriobacteriia bacterium]
MGARSTRKGLRRRAAASVVAGALVCALSLTGTALSADVPIATVGVGLSPAAIAVNPITHRVYVANFYDDTVSVIDGVTDSNVATIPMPPGQSIPVPNAVVVNAISSPPRAYVANWQSHTVSFIDESTLTKTATVTVPASNGLGNPRALALWATSTPPKLYVANYHRDSVSVLNAETGASIAEIPVGSSPRALAIFTSATRKRLYVANRYSNNVSIVNMETDAVVATAATGAGPKAMAVNQSTGDVYVTSPASDTVTVINDTDAVEANVAVGDNPLGVDIDETTGRIFVADYASNDVVVIDSATNAVEATIGVATQPWAVAADQGDRKVFVTNYGADQVTIIDRDLAVTTCAVGYRPYALAVDEGSTPHKTYCANWGSNNVTVIDEPAPIAGLLGPTVARAGGDVGAESVAVTVTPLPGDATTSVTPTISGTARSARSPYRTPIAAVFVRVDGASALQRATITGGAGTPDVSWQYLPASPLSVGAHEVSVVVFDDASASAVSSGQDQAARSASPAGGAVYGFDVDPPFGSIAGTITASGLPQVRIVVSAFDAETNSYRKGVFTDAFGRYAVSGLSAGTYHLRFTGTTPSTLSQYYDHTSAITAATTLTVTGGAVTPASSDLAPPAPTAGTIAGSITAGGLPQARIVVTAFDAATNSYRKGVFTDLLGGYAITGLTPGTYHLRFTGTTPSSLSQYYDHKATITAATTLTVDPGAVTAASSDLAP